MNCSQRLQTNLCVNLWLNKTPPGFILGNDDRSGVIGCTTFNYSTLNLDISFARRSMLWRLLLHSSFTA